MDPETSGNLRHEGNTEILQSYIGSESNTNFGTEISNNDEQEKFLKLYALCDMK